MAPSPGQAHLLVRKEITTKQKRDGMSMLIGLQKDDGSLPRGAINSTAKKVGVARKAMSRVWNSSHTSRERGVIFSPDVNSKKTGVVGKKAVYDKNEMVEVMKQIPLVRRMTVRKLASQLGVSHTFLVKWKKEKGIVRHTSSLLTVLTEQNMLWRREFCLSEVVGSVRSGFRYKDMNDRIHLDEKWFYLTREGTGYYLTADETVPQRRTRNKHTITKVMFLCCQARPRMVRGRLWDGRIGIWEVGRVELTKRAGSRNPRGTPKWVNETIDRVKYRELLLEKVLPCVKAKWPGGDVFIQQDGARAHLPVDDLLFREGVSNLGVNYSIKLYFQPANSPDLNILDLGFFRAIQSFNDTSPQNEFDLIDGVKQAYWSYPPHKINRVFLTLQACMNEILNCGGDNTYKLPHMNKDRLEREGCLPTVLKVTDKALEFLVPEEATTLEAV